MQNQAEYMMTEVHEGVCGSHIGGRVLAAKIIQTGYYWPTLTGNYMMLVRKCDKC